MRPNSFVFKAGYISADGNDHGMIHDIGKEDNIWSGVPECTRGRNDFELSQHASHK